MKKEPYTTNFLHRFLYILTKERIPYSRKNSVPYLGYPVQNFRKIEENNKNMLFFRGFVS